MTDDEAERLYGAEARAIDGSARRWRRWSHVVAFVDDVLAGPMWEELYPDAPLEVNLARRSRSSRMSLTEGNRAAAAIHIADGQWTGPTVVHELAHVAAGPEAGHGPAFVRAELELVRRLLGFHAYGALRSEFERVGLAFDEPR